MVIDGMHYSPNCNCKGCKQIRIQNNSMEKENTKEMEAARKAYKAGLGAGEWKGFMEKQKEKQCDCGCHTSLSSSEEMRKNGCDLCYSGSEYYPRHKEQPKARTLEYNKDDGFEPKESNSEYWEETFDKEFLVYLIDEIGLTNTIQLKILIQEILDKQKENIREYCLDERDKAEKEKDSDDYANGYFIGMNTVVKYIDRL